MAMSGYWWECSCGNQTKSVHGKGGQIPTFIRRSIIESGFDQKLLVQPCPKCKVHAPMRITYHFPRNVRETVQVLHIVGLDGGDGGYVPMLWETMPKSSPSKRWFHFNYMIKQSPWGLNKAAVLSLEDIRRLLELYGTKTGRSLPFSFARAVGK